MWSRRSELDCKLDRSSSPRHHDLQGIQKIEERDGWSHTKSSTTDVVAIALETAAFRDLQRVCCNFVVDLGQQLAAP